MRFYDVRGGALEKGEHPWYYSEDGELKPVPSMFDDKEYILEFLTTCIKSSYPDVDDNEIEEIWNEYEDYKAKIIEAFRILKDENYDAGDKHRARAYGNAVRTLSRVNSPIASGKQAMKLRGIGKSLSAKIDEILRTGELKKIEKKSPGKIARRRSKREILKEFESIYDVGEVKAEQWYKKGYRSIEDIRRFEKRNLTKAGRKTLKYYESLTQPIPRASIDYQKKMWKMYLDGIDPSAKFAVVGSYRRGSKTSGDVDVLIASKKGSVVLSELVKALEFAGNIKAVLQRKGEKITTICEMIMGPPVAKVDFFYVPVRSWGPGLLAWTGPGDFVRYMRAEAKRKGFKLNDVALKNLKTGEIMHTPSEKSIFDILGMKYVPPQMRH